MYMRVLRTVLATLMVVAFSACVAQRTSGPPVEVRTLGASANLAKGDFGSYADLRDLQGLRHLYAVGPVEHLGGEILVID